MNYLDYKKRFLDFYSSYFDIEEDVIRRGKFYDFAGEFKQKNSRYFMMRNMQYYSFSNNEKLYFRQVDRFSDFDTVGFADSIRIEGLGSGFDDAEHMETMVSLFLVVLSPLDEGERRRIRKLNRSISVRFGMGGWIAFKLIVFDPSAGEITTNRFGRRDMKNLRRFIKTFERG